jgi:hypothetical protein
VPREAAPPPPLSDAGDPGGATANRGRKSNAILANNAFQYGVAYPETIVLLQRGS